MNRYSFITVLISLLLLPSCVEDVDFSSAGNKKIVVHCVIHSVVDEYAWLRPMMEVDLPRDYIIHPERQHLYMYYSTPDGKRQYLSQVSARLFDDETNEMLAEFSRVSDEEWQAEYIPFFIQGEKGVEYSLKLRLEITDIPGEETIIAYTSFIRVISTSAVKYWKWEPAGDYGYTQEETIPTPAWFFGEARKYHFFSSGDLGPGWISDVSPLAVKQIQSDYHYADSFNSTERDFLYGVRVREDNNTGPFHFHVKICGYVQPPASDYLVQNFVDLHYVSEDYDRYLQDAIVFRIRHDNDTDPLKHLCEDQVYTNIPGGLGIFGAEVIVMNDVWKEKWW